MWTNQAEPLYIPGSKAMKQNCGVAKRIEMKQSKIQFPCQVIIKLKVLEKNSYRFIGYGFG
jgi:hypothetical protein